VSRISRLPDMGARSGSSSPVRASVGLRWRSARVALSGSTRYTFRRSERSQLWCSPQSEHLLASFASSHSWTWRAKEWAGPVWNVMSTFRLWATAAASIYLPRPPALDHSGKSRRTLANLAALSFSWFRRMGHRRGAHAFDKMAWYSSTLSGFGSTGGSSVRRLGGVHPRVGVEAPSSSRSQQRGQAPTASFIFATTSAGSCTSTIMRS
jgi:hypothetical protein